MQKRIVLALSATVLALGVSGCGSNKGGAGDAAGGPVEEPGMAAPVDDLMKQAQELFKPIPLNPPKLEGNWLKPADFE